jgi:threonine/homoserine/homoserine lactone efflux protein
MEEVTNPKTALFFLALLPQFVMPEAGPAAPQLLIHGLTNSHSLRNTL